MLRILLITICLSVSVKTFAQASDFIVVKKRNGKTIKTFFPGLSISFEAIDQRPVSGLIMAIKNDSIFVKEFDIRPMYSIGGIPITDTAATYLSAFNYKEIGKVEVTDYRKALHISPGPILIVGGAGYALLNVINGAYLHESITSSKNLTSLGIAAGAVGVGLLYNYISRHANKYHVEYVHMNEAKKRGF